METGDIQAAPPMYTPDENGDDSFSDEKNGTEESNTTEEINYKTLTWW